MSSIKFWFRERGKWILFWLFLIVLVSMSFGLGYLAGRQDNPAPIVIEKNSQ
ncbi:MAG: hypothetical protein UY23_C0001G0040 [Candidatus Jorgensenbacteria bacterium GW2011_GWA1_48_11]|uniref:Uncharacterized protein n=1 Tax=Candidatus Jorgensenbacteria bacterium GW2011_GWA1_48_11 TaxID=1618660 RepID=A0A0G1UBD8_9BACT|nr:MAG: hypothetical protein UY23_C0001G0040 [Candidatus Jorgensenbacteria bacterium GW2011_GWA1_48_11]KKW11928.1 MAG: hypothetical protein UY51_C0005G0170 [Candidatus Jorgensenbacteria bacterium GW2011_GWB1_49_9]